MKASERQGATQAPKWRPASGDGKVSLPSLPRDVKEVLVADTKTVNVVVRTMRRVYIVGAVLGDTNVFFYDDDGRQIAALDVCVSEYHRPRNDKSGIGSDKATIATLYESDGFVP